MSPMNSITFNGISSATYGMYVSGNQTFNSAVKDYEKVSIPGRSGDLLIFNKRYQNVDVNYDAFVIPTVINGTSYNYNQTTELIRAWLLSADGYCRLTDTYHPNEYRMAAFSGPIDFDTILLEAGQTTLTFDCKPQRWLTSGETAITINRPSTGQITTSISNPTKFEAKPLVRVYGTGSVIIGSGGFIINTSGSSYIDIDCEIQECYEGSNNRNSNVTIGEWPTLTSGVNGIAADRTITKIIITPRWWTL